MESVMDLVQGFFLLIVLVFLYFLPALLANGRKHPNFAPIFIVNLFFGWTLLGWVICLAWSLSQVKKNAE
jgi:hypothetical protein